MRLLLFVACFGVFMLEPTFVNAQEYLRFGKIKTSAIYRLENRDVIIVTNSNEVISGTLFVLNSITGNYLAVWNEKTKKKVRLEISDVQDIMAYNKDLFEKITNQVKQDADKKTDDNLNTAVQNSSVNTSNINRKAINYDDKNVIVILNDSSAVIGRLIYFYKTNNSSYFSISTLDYKVKKRIEPDQVYSIFLYNATLAKEVIARGYAVTNFFDNEYKANNKAFENFFNHANIGILNNTALPMDGSAYVGLNFLNGLHIGGKLFNHLEIDLMQNNTGMYLGESSVFLRAKVGSQNKTGINMAYAVNIGTDFDNYFNRRSITNFQMVHFSTNNENQFLNIGIGSVLPVEGVKEAGLGAYSAAYGYQFTEKIHGVAEAFGIFKHQNYQAVGMRYLTNKRGYIELSFMRGQKAYYYQDWLIKEEVRETPQSFFINLGFKQRLY